MIITDKWLKDHNACTEGVKWVKENHPNTEAAELVQILAKYRFDWANWLIARVLNKRQRMQYAVHAARMVLPIFEKKYPDDDRPRKAIEAAENYIKTGVVDAAARDAAYAADAARDARAADAARAAYAAADAARAAYAAADAARAYAIITYGIRLIKEGLK